MGMAFAQLLLLAPVFDTSWLVGFDHICDLELRIHLSEHKIAENAY